MAHRSLMPAQENSERRTMSYEEFLATSWDNPHVEWVNGEAIEMPPVGLDHSRESNWLIRLVGDFVEAKALGEVHHDPFQMKTAPHLPGRSPDILFVTNENLSRLRGTYLEGPADLVVEIVSPGTATVDRGDKYYEYEQGGVREYWLIDPSRRSAEFYRLDDGGVFRPVSVGEGVFRSEVLPGFWLKVEWLWPGTQPPVLTVLKEWGLV